MIKLSDYEIKQIVNALELSIENLEKSSYNSILETIKIKTILDLGNIIEKFKSKDNTK